MRSGPFRSLGLLALACTLLGVGGCAAGGFPSPAAVDRGPAPAYADVARSYNQRVARLERIWAYAVIRIVYLDEQGERHKEQGEGTLQVIRPDRLALSIKKLGETLFWLGCDAQRYWWFDLTDQRVASVGRHEEFGRPGGGRVGIAIYPLDLIRLLGVTPLEPEGGATQWSRDGKLLGVTTRVRDGYQRLWLDPAVHEARKVELFDAGKRPVLISDLEQYTHMTVSSYGGPGPRTAGRVLVYHPETETEIRLSLSQIEDGTDRIQPQAFSFETLVDRLGVETVVDADRRRDPVPDVTGLDAGER